MTIKEKIIKYKSPILYFIGLLLITISALLFYYTINITDDHLITTAIILSKGLLGALGLISLMLPSTFNQ